MLTIIIRVTLLQLLHSLNFHCVITELKKPVFDSFVRKFLINSIKSKHIGHNGCTDVLSISYPIIYVRAVCKCDFNELHHFQDF